RRMSRSSRPNACSWDRLSFELLQDGGAEVLRVVLAARRAPELPDHGRVDHERKLLRVDGQRRHRPPRRVVPERAPGEGAKLDELKRARVPELGLLLGRQVEVEARVHGPPACASVRAPEVKITTARAPVILS